MGRGGWSRGGRDRDQGLSTVLCVECSHLCNLVLAEIGILSQLVVVPVQQKFEQVEALGKRCHLLQTPFLMAKKGCLHYNR